MLLMRMRTDITPVSQHRGPSGSRWTRGHPSNRRTVKFMRKMLESTAILQYDLATVLES